MNSFTVNMPKKIHFNVSLPKHARNMLFEYSNILLLVGEDDNYKEYISNLLEGLNAEGKNVTELSVSDKLTDIGLESLFANIGEEHIDAVLAVGNGSVMDAGKILSAYITNRATTEEYLNEEISFVNKSVPLFLAPTTAGSTEANSSVVILSGETGYFLKEIRNRAFIADEIIIDPVLQMNTSKEISLNAMMITLTRLVEGYVSVTANNFCDALIADCINDFIAAVYDICINDNDSAEARAAAAYASVIASVTMEHTGSGIVSSIANAVTSVYNIPYGAVCGSLFYQATLKNIQKTQVFAPNSVATEKYSRLASIWSGIVYEYEKHNVLLRSLNHNLSDLTEDLKLPGLEELGVRRESIYNIVSKINPSQNPVNLAESEFIDILEASF